MQMSWTGISVVFDLDGTLVDTAPDLCRALNHVLASEGLSLVPLADARPFVGHGARKLIERAYGKQGVDVSDRRLDELTERFVDYYSQHIAVDSRPFPGLADCLTQLQAAGANLGVCTNKREGLSTRLLQELDLSDAFSAVVGADTLDVRKPHPGHLLGTIERLGGSPARSVMVGDSSTDADAARAADVALIAVAFGYRDTPLDTFDAAEIIAHFDELVPAIQRIFTGNS